MRVFDRNVSLANLFEVNRIYIEKEIPHIAALMSSSMDELITNSDVVVFGNIDQQFRERKKDINGDLLVIDLVRISDFLEEFGPNYEGLCW